MSSMRFDLLRLLSDASFHSGAALAKALRVSPSEARAALRELEGHGVELVCVRGRGYRLEKAYDWIDAAAVQALLGAHARHFRLELLEACSSTNTLLLERARAGALAGEVIASELQTAGRGRRGNTWQSGLGGGLTFSVLWRFAHDAAALSGLSLAVGVALARALASVGAAEVQLKWPNDLVHAGRKLGGILIEVHADGPAATAAVIGIGLNVRMSPALRDEVTQAVTDVASICEALPPRNRLLAAALSELAQVLEQFAREGFAPLREEWISRHAHQGKAVTLSSGDGGTVTGRAAGVAEDGALLLETARGVQRFVSGKLSLRAGAPNADLPA